jgi:hypothetical protein
VGYVMLSDLSLMVFILSYCYCGVSYGMEFSIVKMHSILANISVTMETPYCNLSPWAQLRFGTYHAFL